MNLVVMMICHSCVYSLFPLPQVAKKKLAIVGLRISQPVHNTVLKMLL